MDSRDPHALRAIQQRVRLGEIEEQLTERRRICTWRVTAAREVRQFLGSMLPYLTTAWQSASQAIDRLDEIDAKQRAREQRDREIVALWLANQPQPLIASALGCGLSTVSEVIAAA